MKFKDKVPLVTIRRTLKLPERKMEFLSQILQLKKSEDMWLMKFLGKSYMLLQMYSNFNLEDNVDFKGEGIVTKLLAGR